MFPTLHAATSQPSRPPSRRPAFSHRRRSSFPHRRRPPFPHRRRPPFPQSVKRESRVPARGRGQTFGDFPTATPQPPHPPRPQSVKRARSLPLRWQPESSVFIFRHTHATQLKTLDSGSKPFVAAKAAALIPRRVAPQLFGASAPNPSGLRENPLPADFSCLETGIQTPRMADCPTRRCRV